MVKRFLIMRTASGRTSRRFALRACLLSFITGCAAMVAPGYDLPALPPSPPGPYRLGSGDEVTIRIFDQSQLSGLYSVDDSGFIDMPLLGLIRAAGMSPDTLGGNIALALQARNLILNPSVAVEVSRYRPFYILGEVNAPGQYAYRPGMTVLTAISIAGGFTYRAEQNYAGITRDRGSAAVQYRAANDAMAQPGDVITVFERRF
jgi:polysaccharide export outer membrane protein